MTNTLAELSIGYPHSPLTQTGRHVHSGPAAGSRVPVSSVDPPIGSGDTPRFALFAHANPACAALIARHRDLLEPEPRPPLGEDGIGLVRPDGYVALAAASNEWDKISAYFDQVGLR